jgi:hypothetical protein
MISTLNEALEFISNYVPPKSPDGRIAYPVLEDGLSYAEIKQKIKDLPFDLPTEVYELYQWSDGGFLGNLPYPSRSDRDEYAKIDKFIPLDRAVTLAKDWSNGSFPLFESDDGEICFTVGSQIKQKAAPIFCRHKSSVSQQPKYDSLTTMMIKLVEGIQAETSQK